MTKRCAYGTYNTDHVTVWCKDAIKDRIAKTEREPEAIVLVALYGMPYKIDRIMEIVNRYGIPVIEDAAEGFGSRCLEGHTSQMTM